MEIGFNNLGFLPNVAARFDGGGGGLNNGAASGKNMLVFPSSRGCYLIVGAEVLVFLHHLQLLSRPHQHRPHASARQVGVELRREDADPSWGQSLEKNADERGER